MKQPLTTLKCINEKCGYEETTHKNVDGKKCIKCDGPTMAFPAASKPYTLRKRCLVCGSTKNEIYDSKEEIQDVSVCESCSGAMVDPWKCGIHASTQSNSEAMPKIVIVIDDIKNAPKICIGGSEVKGLLEVDYKYRTKTNEKFGIHSVDVTNFNNALNVTEKIGYAKWPSDSGVTD